MAYAAATSLRHTISQLLKSGHDIQIAQNSSPEMIELLRQEGRSLANVLERLDHNSRRFSSQRLNIALDAQIRDAVFKLEDVVESHLLHQFVSQSQNNIHQQHPFLFSLDLEELKPVIDSLIEKVNKLKPEYIYELSSNNLPIYDKEEEDDDALGESRMFGISSNHLFMEIKDMMLRSSAVGNHRLCIWGMAGIGKTTLARKLFQDPSISSHYDNRAFVTVGPQYQLADVYLDILKQVDPNSIDDEEIIMFLEAGNHQEKLGGLRRRLNEYLKDRKYLIVLDDTWDEKMLFGSDALEYKNDGSHILLTTRLEFIAKACCYWKIPFLDKKESWALLCAKVFGEQQDESSLLCPSELKKAGKKIAENCEGLPLTIVKVADTLSKQEMTPEHWNEVAANKQHSVYVDAYAQMHKVLLPSYYNLPQYLRISFLYMGLFPQNYKIPCTKLRMLWTVEGFIDLRKPKHSVHYNHFDKLASDSVLVVDSSATIGTYKTVGLHSSFWYLCKKEAGKSKFFHGFSTLGDCSPQGIETQRRLCVYNPVLFAIRDASDKIASVLAARSLLCTGVYHQYPVPICLGLKLLKVLDALTIRFYEFPMEVLKLIHLTYLALTCDGDLPTSISKLWNLEYLIVDRHVSIKSIDGAPSYLPVEIWYMKKLVHLQVRGSDLPEPPPKGSLMMLLKLLDVSLHSCTETTLERLPNLTKLGIRIELSPDDQTMGCFDHIRHMSKLTAFKCVVVNPSILFEVGMPPPVPLPIFPEYLGKLTLSGLGYPWEEMRKISSLPKLTVLKLLSYAFRGPKWDVRDKEFPSLEVLVIKETDLVKWTIKDDYRIENLRFLSIKHCYNLKEMPMDFTIYLRKVEMIDCNPLVMGSANKLKADFDRRHNLQYRGLDLNVHSSCKDRN